MNPIYVRKRSALIILRNKMDEKDFPNIIKSDPKGGTHLGWTIVIEKQSLTVIQSNDVWELD